MDASIKKTAMVFNFLNCGICRASNSLLGNFHFLPRLNFYLALQNFYLSSNVAHFFNK